MKPYKQRNGKEGKKFMQVLDLHIWKQLQKLASGRGVTVQEYLRVIVIPDHLKLKFGIHAQGDFRINMKKSKAAKKAWKIRKAKPPPNPETILEQIPLNLQPTHPTQ